MSKNLSELAGKKGIDKGLFELLGEASQKKGSPSREDLKKLADEFLVGTSSAYGSATFYDFMKPENAGKKVYVCNGSACLCAGTQDSVLNELKNHFNESEIGHMTCLGRCHENSAFHINGQNYSAKSANEIADVIKGEGSNDDHYSIAAQKEILTSEFEGFEKTIAIMNKVLNMDSQLVLDEIIKSNVRGRGGAGFPMGFKWNACRNEQSEQKFIICNADEGDPGAYSDRYILENRPHHLLIGMMIAGYCTGSEWGILYIRGEYPESIDVIESTIQEFQDNDWLGENIQNSGFNFNFKVVKAQGAYICGEETALINSIEGQRPEVRTRPPYPTQVGLFNRPTIVNNVETLAAAYHILKDGGEAYKSIGTEKSSGTKLVCLDSFFNNPGIYEVEMGTPLSKVIDDFGGGFKVPVKALHIGGPLGGLVPKSKIKDLNIDFESFSSNGFLLGHASVVSIPDSFPMIEYLEHLFDFASYESCGKCFPCRLGTKRGHEMMSKARSGEYKLNRELVVDLLTTLEQGSLCAHGGGIPLPVRNALEYFEDELKPFFE